MKAVKELQDKTYEWVKRIIKGASGFLVFEDREFVVFRDGREVGVAEFVINCLANPQCEGSKEVLDAILQHRNASDTRIPKTGEYTCTTEFTNQFQYCYKLGSKIQVLRHSPVNDSMWCKMDDGHPEFLMDVDDLLNHFVPSEMIGG